ncbi:hypothetical protein CR513_12838, partial [Mucuna pruriens]
PKSGPISITPYRIELFELSELKKQLEYLLEREFIRLACHHMSANIKVNNEGIPKNIFRTRYKHFEYAVKPLMTSWFTLGLQRGMRNTYKQFPYHDLEFVLLRFGDTTIPTKENIMSNALSKKGIACDFYDSSRDKPIKED